MSQDAAPRPALVDDSDVPFNATKASLHHASALLLHGVRRRASKRIPVGALADCLRVGCHVVYHALPGSYPPDQFALCPEYVAGPRKAVMLHEMDVAELAPFNREVFADSNEYAAHAEQRRVDFTNALSLIPVPPPYPFEAFIQEVLDATADEAAIVAAMATWVDNMSIHAVREFLRVGSESDPVDILADLAGLSRVQVQAALEGGVLRRLGLVSANKGLHSFMFTVNALGEGFFTLHPGLHSALSGDVHTAADFAARLKGRRLDPSPDLSWEDFAHLGELRDIALACVRSGGFKGANILLVGPPGTGKTQFAAMLAREAGRTMFSVGEATRKGSEPTRDERFAALKAALGVTKGEAVLLLDEAEDVLRAPGGSTDQFAFSKAHLNNFLDEVSSPVLWTANTVERMEEATLRRMALVIPFETPGPKIRERIWRRTLESAGLPDADPSMLARDWAVSAGLGATAARTAAVSGKGSAVIPRVLDGFSQVMGDLRAKDSEKIPDFDPELCETAEDVAAMMETLRACGRLDWSMCLYGPPGTGKSAFARHVAQALGMEVLLRRASDLKARWLGETEQNIAKAFAQARMERKVLIMDEADSMLRDREKAVLSWEVSIVNEMLTQMESHPLPFFATTNLLDELDRASLRRFVFKMEFRELPPERVPVAFRRILGVEPPSHVRWPERISAGDIAGLKKRASILGVKDGLTLLRWLEEEVAVKTGGRAGRIGF